MLISNQTTRSLAKEININRKIRKTLIHNRSMEKRISLSILLPEILHNRLILQQKQNNLIYLKLKTLINLILRCIHYILDFLLIRNIKRNPVFDHSENSEHAV